MSARSVTSSDVDAFLNRIGGLPTLFGLIVAIEDSLQAKTVKRALTRVFEQETGGDEKMMKPEVIQYLLLGMSAASTKHVRLVSLQQAHQFVRSDKTRRRLMEMDMLTALINLLHDEDVEITEEIVLLLRELGSTYDGAEKLLHPETLALLFRLVYGGPSDKDIPTVINAKCTDTTVVSPLLHLIQTGASNLNSIVLMRVLTLLTHIACGTKLPTSENGPKMKLDADRSKEEVTLHAWELYSQYGLFRLLLELSSISPNNPHHDMLVQLNCLELLSEVVSSCPRLDDPFSVQLTKDILDRSVETIREAASAASQSKESNGQIATGGVIPTMSFITVAILRVFNSLAAVSEAKSVHQWYHEPAFLLFLSACMHNYDDESVQTEAIDLISTLASFEAGIRFFSTVTSSLPSSVAPSTTSAYLSSPYADAITPILLFQTPFFIYGSNYSNGLRQIASLHGMARMLSTAYPSSSASRANDSSSSPSSLLETFYSYLIQYNPNKSSPLDVLLILARQPFEDVREGVWKVVYALTKHEWVRNGFNQA